MLSKNEGGSFGVCLLHIGNCFNSSRLRTCRVTWTYSVISNLLFCDWNIGRVCCFSIWKFLNQLESTVFLTWLPSTEFVYLFRGSYDLKLSRKYFSTSLSTGLATGMAGDMVSTEFFAKLSAVSVSITYWCMNFFSPILESGTPKSFCNGTVPNSAA